MHPKVDVTEECNIGELKKVTIRFYSWGALEWTFNIRNILNHFAPRVASGEEDRLVFSHLQGSPWSERVHNYYNNYNT